MAARKKKREKPFARKTQSLTVAQVKEMDVVEAVVDKDEKSEASSTSNDSAFVAKLISPNAKHISKMITTPIKKEEIQILKVD